MQTTTRRPGLRYDASCTHTCVLSSQVYAWSCRSYSYVLRAKKVSQARPIHWRHAVHWCKVLSHEVQVDAINIPYCRVDKPKPCNPARTVLRFVRCVWQELRGRIQPGTTLGATGKREKSAMEELAKAREKACSLLCEQLCCTCLNSRMYVHHSNNPANQAGKEKEGFAASENRKTRRRSRLAGCV